MTVRKQPLTVFILAMVAFLITSIVPVGYMLSRFTAGLFDGDASGAVGLLDGRQLVLLGRSLWVAVLSTAVALVLGLPAAVMLSAKDLPFRKVFFFLVLIPLLIPPYVMAGAWVHLLSPDGIINGALRAVLGDSARVSLFSVPGCAWCLGISFFPVIAIITATGLAKVNGNLIDVARLSTGRWGVFWHGTLPQIWHHLAAAVCLVMIFVLGRYGVPSLLGINTYPVEIFAQFSAFYDDNSAVGTSLPLIFLVIALVVLQRWIMRNRDYVSFEASSNTTGGVKLGRTRGFAAGSLAIIFVLTVVLPFAAVLPNVNSFAAVVEAIRSAKDSILSTTLMGLIAATAATAIALPIAAQMTDRSRRFWPMFDILCWLPVAIPGTILGLGLVKLLNNMTWLRNADSFGVFLVLGYIGMFTAFSIRILEASYRRADPNIAESAALECSNWYQRLLHIDLPVHAGAIATSIILVFVLAVGELNATVLLIPPGRATLAVDIDNLLHYGASARASALCLVEAGLVVAIVAVGLFFFHYRRRKA